MKAVNKKFQENVVIYIIMVIICCYLYNPPVLDLVHWIDCDRVSVLISRRCFLPSKENEWLLCGRAMIITRSPDRTRTVLTEPQTSLDTKRALAVTCRQPMALNNRQDLAK